ncbi:MAG: hypothetical protein WC610_00880 [Patescibacteria group bacterium]
MRRPFGSALIRQWFRNTKYFLGLGSFANELRKRVGKRVLFFLKVDKDICLSLNHSKDIPAWFCRDIILAVVEDCGDYYVADYVGSLISLDPTDVSIWRPKGRLSIKVPKYLTESDNPYRHPPLRKLLDDSQVIIPERRITAIILSDGMHKAMQLQRESMA